MSWLCGLGLASLGRVQRVRVERYCIFGSISEVVVYCNSIESIEYAVLERLCREFGSGVSLFGGVL